MRLRSALSPSFPPVPPKCPACLCPPFRAAKRQGSLAGFSAELVEARPASSEDEGCTETPQETQGDPHRDPGMERLTGRQMPADVSF